MPTAQSQTHTHHDGAVAIARSARRGVPPRVAKPKGPPRPFLPLGLRRQPHSGPTAITRGIEPADTVGRMVVTVVPSPVARLAAGRFGTGARFDTQSILGLGYLELLQEIPVQEYRVGG